jgi:hypothetical protein
VSQDSGELSTQLSKLSDLSYRKRLSSGVFEMVENNFNIQPPEEIVFQDLNNLFTKGYKHKQLNSTVLADLIHPRR